MRKSIGLLFAIFLSFAFSGVDNEKAARKKSQKKLMVYVDHFFDEQKEKNFVFIKISKGKDYWMSCVRNSYANVPVFDSPGTFVIDAVDGGIYTITGAYLYKNTIIMYGPATVTITAECNSIAVPF